MKLLQFMFFTAVFSAAGCGREIRSVKHDSNRAQNDANASKESEALPEAAIVRVPVNADGVEDPSKAELRLQYVDTGANDEASTAAAWEQGDVVSNWLEVLDENTSTQSYFRRGHHGGGYHRRGYHRRGYYGGVRRGWGHHRRYWPVYHRTGRYYYYGYPRRYYHRGYYYYYHRPYGR